MLKRLRSSLGTLFRPFVGAIAVAMLAASTATAQGGPLLVHRLDSYGAMEGPRGEVLPPARYGELLPPLAFDARARMREEKSFRGALRMGLIGAAGGALAGFGMEVVDPHGEIADIWPTLLAIPGFFVGLVYYAVR